MTADGATPATRVPAGGSLGRADDGAPAGPIVPAGPILPAGPTLPAGPILLGASAARSCAVKTHNAFDPTVQGVPREIDDSLADLFEGAEEFSDRVLARLAAACTGRVIDLRLAADLPAHVQSGATAEAVASGAELIIGGLLPYDLDGGRSGRPDALLRGRDRADGRPGYHVLEIKMHKIIERKGRSVRPQPNDALLVSPFTAVQPEDADEVAGYGFRVSSRESDLLQLAHYQRMLQAHGWDATGPPYAGLIGTDTLPEQITGGVDADRIVWMDLGRPLLRTFSRSDDQGWTLRTVLQRYDHEHAFRLDVAAVARRQDSAGVRPAPLVQPIVTRECSRCPWWDLCRSKLPDDDVSLRVGKGALDVREIATLRANGISTVADLAEVDLDRMLAWYLPEVRHRMGAEERLRRAARRAALINAGVSFERVGTGPIDVPGAEIEIDFDIETTFDGLIYLWGFRVHRGTSDAGEYRAFALFEDLDADQERELAIGALSWLREQADRAGSVRIYHYSGFEVAALTRLAEEHPTEPVFEWATEFAGDHFCDLLPLVKENFFGVDGIGLKVVATEGAGFTWRDDDAGGLNSTRWFVDAVHGETESVREQARARVLAYNEDDVIATAKVRSWLRGL